MLFIESQLIYNIVLVSGIQHSDSDVYVYVCVCCINGSSLLAQTVKNPRAKQETWVRSLGWEDPLEKEMAALSSILAWGILLPYYFYFLLLPEPFLFGHSHGSSSWNVCVPQSPELDFVSSVSLHFSPGIVPTLVWLQLPSVLRLLLNSFPGNSYMIQWLRLCGSLPRPRVQSLVPRGYVL